jgi:hypothetical protein
MKRELTSVLMLIVSAIISLISVGLTYRDNNVNVPVVMTTTVVALSLAAVAAVIKLRGQHRRNH